jgi:pimeloyl-ACP methyl ester carboxylesterase
VRPTVTLHFGDSGPAGSGPALVLLDGWCDSGENWASTVAALKAQYRCIVPDIRGCGRSGMQRDHCFSSEALSNDVVELCAALGIERAVLIGHSYGGFLAAETARRFPGFARGVVVEDQPLELSGLSKQVRELETAIRSPESHMAFRTQLFDSMTGNLPEADLALIRKAKDATPIEVGQALWAALFEFTPEEIGQRSDQLMAALSNQPSLSIDASHNPEYYAALLSRSPSVQTRIIESGHWIHLECPAEFQAAVREFVASL